MQASIVGPGGESELSAVATWVLDNVKPKVQITVAQERRVDQQGRRPRSRARPRPAAPSAWPNDVNGATATVAAGKDGLWTSPIAIGQGINTITITITDPAGNVNTGTLALRRGSGKLIASLTGSAYRFKASKLPRTVTFTVVVTDPDGRRLSGATALFTVSVPGLQAIVSGQIRTNSSGSATFTTTIPKGAMPGSGLATVLVTASGLGTTTDRQVLTVE